MRILSEMQIDSSKNWLQLSMAETILTFLDKACYPPRHSISYAVGSRTYDKKPMHSSELRSHMTTQHTVKKPPSHRQSKKNQLPRSIRLVNFDAGEVARSCPTSERRRSNSYYDQAKNSTLSSSPRVLFRTSSITSTFTAPS